MVLTSLTAKSMTFFTRGLHSGLWENFSNNYLLLSWKNMAKETKKYTRTWKIIYKTSLIQYL